MRLAFMGSPDFAVPALRALHGAGHEIAAVYCQPPRPAGRGQAVRRCPVQVAAEALGLVVRTPARLRRDVGEHDAFRAMLEAPRRGCLNIHASLLPRWRGAAPIQAAILAGDAETGITIMQMDEGLDTGAMLLRDAVPIGPATTAAGLHDVLAEMGARLVLRALAEAPAPLAQPEDGACYAPKLSREDGRIDWGQPAAVLDRQVRALNPWPGTFTALDGEVLKVLAAVPAEGAGAPGEVLDSGLLVAAGAGALRLTRVQAPGRAAMAAEAFLRGRAVGPGTRLG